MAAAVNYGEYEELYTCYKTGMACPYLKNIVEMSLEQHFGVNDGLPPDYDPYRAISLMRQRVAQFRDQGHCETGPQLSERTSQLTCPGEVIHEAMGYVEPPKSGIGILRLFRSTEN